MRVRVKMNGEGLGSEAMQDLKHSYAHANVGGGKGGEGGAGGQCYFWRECGGAPRGATPFKSATAIYARGA